MKTYKEFIVTAEPFNAEILSSLLWELDIEGVQEDVNCLRLFANANSGVTIDQVNELLQKLIEQKLIFSFNAEENSVLNKNWNEEWEKSINIIHVSDRIVIKPTFRTYEKKNDEIVITIDPKMSFGTGEHQTTKLVLSLLEKYVSPGMKILDVGSGTAVLSIAAIMLGADSAVAIDNDEWCLDNAKENAALNIVENKIDIRIGEIKDVEDKNFNLITANIQKNILMQIAGEIYTHADQNALILLSGLLDVDEKDIVKEYEAIGFELIEKEQMDEWIALAFRKG